MPARPTRCSPLLFAALLTGVAVVAPQAQSGVTLSKAVSPAAAQPGVHMVYVTGSGFPTGTIPAANVMVTVERATAGGVSATGPATSVTTVVGSTRRIGFQVPATIAVTTPTQYLVSLAGTTSTRTAFATLNKVLLTLNPPAAITAISPATGAAGMPVDVNVVTTYTDFVQGATQASFGPGISVNGGVEGGLGVVTVTSKTSATARITVNPAASPGLRAVVVRTGVQKASWDQGFTVSGSANQAPTANAGGPYSGTAGQAITLTGTGSDPDGDPITFAWTFSGGGSGTGATVTHTFAAAGAYTATLTVSDSRGGTTSATAAVTVAPANQSPTANAGPNQTITLSPGQSSATVTLTGSASSDPDGTLAGYSWSGSPDPADVVAPTVLLNAGVHVFTLMVTDNLGATSGPAQVTITVVQPSPPQVGLSPLTYIVNQGSTLTFAVTGTSPDGRGVALSASPALANATFAATPGTPATASAPGTPAAGTFTFTPSGGQSGIYLVSVQARDSLGLTDIKTAQVTINKVNHAPTIAIAATATIDEGRSLVIPVTAADPDGDILTLTATGLPTHAIYLPSTGTITFTPDNTQGGTNHADHTVTVTANDGHLSSSATVTITVNDVPTGGAGQPGTLALTVDPVESPTFVATQRITGSVGTGGGTPVVPPAQQALITGMNPAIGEQGTTVDVILTGDSGSYATHFASGSSAAVFGAGITVSSLTITSPTQATARVSVASDAAVGSRPATIVTGSETAVSVIGFNVVRGISTITGRLVDADTGLAISGAVATIQGSAFSTTTNADGYYTLLGVPSGAQLLLVNAANHEIVRLSFEAQTGVAINLGTTTARSTVFNPAAPSSVSLSSVVGRGIGDTTGTMTEKEAKQLVSDAWLLVGGQDAGVMDAYGNQLNPALTGKGNVSLTQYGVSRLAEKIRSGESVSLMELLYSFSYGYQWSTTRPGSGTATLGNPPTLPDWLAGLQQMVNRAWADPSNPDSVFAILVFNKGRSLSPDPPSLSHDTRLSALQANLFVASYLIISFDPQGNLSAGTGQPPVALHHLETAPVATAGDARWETGNTGGPNAVEAGGFNEGGTPGFLMGQFPLVVDPGVQGRSSTMRHFWKNFFLDKTNFNYGIAATVVGAGLAMTTAVCVFGGTLGTVILTGVAGVAVGVLCDLAMQQLVVQNLMALVPTPPMPLKADVITSDDGKKTVRVTFFKSPNDSNVNALNSKNDNIYYIYTLYRYNVSPYSFTTGLRTEDVTRKAVANFCSNCPDSYKERLPADRTWDQKVTNPETIVDPDPTPNVTRYYDLTVTRLVGDKTLTDSDGNLGTTLNYWLSLLANLGQDTAGSGFMMTAASPWHSLVKGMKQLTSDFSPMLARYVGDIPPASVDEIEVDKNTGHVYYSDIGKKSLFRVEWPGDSLMGTSFVTTTGFINPGQIGLAIDQSGHLYTDNHASDMAYGGRVFRFTPKVLPITAEDYLPRLAADRAFVGTVNYFSQLLMFANPVSVSRMTYGSVVNRDTLTKGLTIVDEISGCVKELSLLYMDLPDDMAQVVPTMVAKPIAFLPDNSGSVLDLAYDAEDNLYILTNPDVFVVRPGGTPGTVQGIATYVHVGPSAAGMAVDDYGNVYVSTKALVGNGKVLMYPKDACATNADCEPLVIMDELDSPGDIEISKDGRALFIATADGKVAKRYFGVSGVVRDSLGQPLMGANVLLKTDPVGYGRSFKTDLNGRFTAQGLFRSDLVVPSVDITVEYDGKSQTFHTVLGQTDLDGLHPRQYGQTVRGITFVR